MNYPEYVKKILTRIEEAGFEAFVVGGAVRDSLLGRPNHDYDITTSALPEETAEIFKDLHVIKTGIKHGTVTVVMSRNPVEITTYRVDGDYKDSRHPEGVRFTRNLEDDLSRRDFTVNAMAYNEERGLVDLFDGIGDLAKGLIRAVGEPQKRFEEDALRIMRAFRFASKLNFNIEHETLAAAEKCRFGLEKISAERKLTELEGILLGRGVKKALSLMQDARIFEVIAPMISLDTSRFSVVPSLPRDFACRMAFCLVGQKKADEYLSTLRLSNAVSSKTRKLIKLSEGALDLSTDGKLRRFMSECGDLLEETLQIRAALGEDTEQIAKRAELIAKHGDCLYLTQLRIDGRDLAVMGIRGKEVGEILSTLLSKVHDSPELNDRKTLLSLVDSLRKEKS